MIVNALRIALRQLWRNKTRTALTSLGILIGVAAVIAMVNVGQGATRAVEDDLATLGDNLLFVTPGQRHGPGGSPARPFDFGDLEAIEQDVSGVAAAAASNQGSAVAGFGEQTYRTRVTGVTDSYPEVLKWTLASGRTFDPQESLAGAEVCLLGRTPMVELFGARDPLGQAMRVGNFTCTVIGTLEPKGQNTFGIDQDDLVLMPLRTYQRRVQASRDILSIFVSADEGYDSTRLASDLTLLLRQRRAIRPGAEDDFQVRDMAEIASMLDSVSTILTGFLAAVAAVSLLVGGIGIMNIMLVSVTERTREIGIRLAVGALARDVMTQFLVESVVLSVLGGVAGIAVGIAGTLLAATLLDLPVVISPLIIAVSFLFSAFVGVVFGWFPAQRAARLKPIDALRHE